MKIIKYNKLIRDRIPEIIESSGKTAIVEKVQGEDLLDLLNKKLFEELKEYEESNEVEELADLVEVVQAILDYKGVTIEDFNKIREKKNESRGAFKEGLLLIEVVEE
jgi:predicted house-cleaning noncanonical NTP pyrophosphatase (MazG superfamily)